jgi:hypothetical protein
VITINDLPGDQLRPALTTSGSGFAAVWQDNRTGVQVPVLERLTASGGLLDGTGIILNTSRSNAEQTPVYAKTATSQLAVWSDSRAIGDDVYARRYSGSGAKLDTAAIAVSTANKEQSTPSVDWDGVQYTVVWQDHRATSWAIRGARFQEDGTVSDAAGFVISNATGNQLHPDIASGGGASLVVWEDGRGTSTDLYAAIVTTGGAVSVNNIPVCATTGEQLRPSIAWDPTNSVFVVAWLDERAGVGAADVYAARVQANGTVLDSCGVLVSGAANDQRRPSIAASGSQLLVTWVDFRADPSNTVGDVYASRLNAAGGLNVLDPAGIALATASSSEGMPTVGGLDTGGWGVVWTDDVNFATNGNDLYGNTVLSTGALAGATYPVSTGTADSESSPEFQAGFNNLNRLYLVYERIGYIDTTRVFRRKLTYP